MNWSQLRTLLWLRWRLTRNQWSRSGRLGAFFGLIGPVVLAILGLFAGAGGLLTGALALDSLSATQLMLVWDAMVGVFLLFWTIGLVTELQRSEIIDLSRLLHLPVSLRGAFLINFLASHLCPSLAVLAPLLFGLALGLVWSRGFAMVLLLPLVAGYFFMITAWTYRLRSWLAALMMNPRRRRAIVMGLTLGFVLLAQTPNLVMNVWLRNNPQAEAALRDSTNQARLKRASGVLHVAVPVLWLPNGARTLATGRFWPALAGMAGSFLVGAWGLNQAYRTTVRLYRGDTDNAPARARPEPRTAAKTGRLLVERQLPLVPEEAAALALTNFRALTRAPEVKMMLAVSIVMMVILPAAALARRGDALPADLRPLLASGAVVISFVGLLQIMINQFGTDRDGFRALVLLPARRSRILLGKNLSLLPFAGGIFVFLLVALTIVARLPLWAVLAACLQFCGGLAGLLVLGNLVSIVLPARIAPGTLKPTKVKGSTALIRAGIGLLFPLVVAPIVLPAGLGLLCSRLEWLPAAPVTLGLSALLAVAGALLHHFTLEPLGALFQRREQSILNVVTHEIE